MDQNSSNGAPGKTNWREKLGIGTSGKELPKISDEFKPASPAANSARPQRVEPKIVSRPAPRAPHPVAKPAPMAPRPAQFAPVPPQPAPMPEPKSESLAERLKSQRQAAERLAEQRIGAVRDTVRETKESKPTPASAREPEQAKSKALAAPSSEAPKFTFAQEELASAKADVTNETSRKYVSAFQNANTPPSPVVPPLVPPRPALGGDKPVLPTAKQEPVGYAGVAGTQPGGYRPLDPPPQRAITPVAPAQPNYGDIAGTYPRQVPATGRREPFDTMRRPAPSRLGAEAGEAALPADDLQRGRRPQQLQRPKRPVSYEDDLGEVFENEEAAPPPRRRARAQDYSQAYREYEDTYDEDERRSSGPWLLLLALLVLAALAFGGIWFYSKYVTPQEAQQTGEIVPVVPAPREQAKVTRPETTTANVNLPEPAPAVKKKLIYDRILGDQAIERGKLVPTEEAPVQPAADQTQQPVPAAGAPADQGLSGNSSATQPPQPIAPTNTQSTDPATGGGAGQPEPLPVPPTPGSNQPQGSLAPVNEQQMTDATVSPASTTNSETVAASEPSSAKEAMMQQQISPRQTIVDEPTPSAKPKARTVEVPVKQKKKVKTSAQKRPSREPAVLNPPASQASDQPVAEQAQTVSGSGSFFGDGSRAASHNAGKQDDKVLSAGRTNFSSKQPDRGLAGDTQVASIDPIEPQTVSQSADQPAASSGDGYVAQLASFRSQAEALSEFDRLKAKHGGILGGMSPRVSKGTVGGTTRYRLGVGPMASKDDASTLCNSLIASGERDCIVKPQ